MVRASFPKHLCVYIQLVWFITLTCCLSAGVDAKEHDKRERKKNRSLRAFCKCSRIFHTKAVAGHSSEPQPDPEPFNTVGQVETSIATTMVS